MSTPIQNPGLFVEAAYGAEGLPGQGGVTGGGEFHDLAWKAALAGAKTQLPASAGEAPLLVAEQSAQIQSIPVVPQGTPGMGGDEIKSEHPLSWDRLSMTVASMVAWNMQVDVADDVITQPVSQPEVQALAINESPFQASGEFDKAVVHDGLDQAQVAVAQAVQSVSLGEVDVEQDDSFPASATNTTEITASPAVLTPFAEVTLDEGPEIKRPEMSVSVASEAHTQPVKSDAIVETVVQTQAPIPQALSPLSSGEALGLAVTVSGSMGPSVSSTVPTDEVQLNPQAVESTSGSPEKFDHQDLILKVNSSSVKNPAAEAGRMRLEAIRGALNELDAQATLRSQVAAFHEGPSTQSTAPVAMTSAVVQKHVGTMTKAPDVPIQAHKARAQSISGTKTDTEGVATVSPEAFTDEPAREQSYRSPELREDAMRRGAPQQARGQAAPVQTSADVTATQTGSINAEISADQDTMTQTAMVDAEHIEAGEVPELPVADPSHLDIDVDDPAGTVRVSMTKESEEVTVRMETPQQVLEEYQDMESDLEKALAMQGLNLSDFDATGQGSDQDETSSSGDDQTRDISSPDEVTPGVQDLEQTGETARLVNRIV